MTNGNVSLMKNWYLSLWAAIIRFNLVEGTSYLIAWNYENIYNAWDITGSCDNNKEVK